MELRKDYCLDRYVIIATDRKKRPQQFKKERKQAEASICYFCPGNEHLTPPEIGRLPWGNSWKIRWFPNKFPALEPRGNPIIETHNTFFTFASAYGYHEVIAETPDHSKQLWDLPKEDVYDLLKIYRHRVDELSKLENINYVQIFKNHGEEAGTSLIHSHTQITSHPYIPKNIKDECKVSKNNCPYCSIAAIEKNSHRNCFENNTFVAFCPYASRFNFEVWIFPKQHLKSLEDFREEHFIDLSDIMTRVLGKLKELNAPYNYYIHYSPKNENLHFHIEILPRFNKWAGFEFSTGTIINAVPPEDAARFYRGEEI